MLPPLRCDPSPGCSCGRGLHAGAGFRLLRQAAWRLRRAERIPADTVGIAVPHADECFELWNYQLQRTATA